MDCLSVEYIAFCEKAKKLSQLFIRLSSEIESIARFTDSMDIFWDGDANTAFTARIGEDLVTMEAVMVRIRKAVLSSHKALEIYLQAEKEVNIMIGEIYARH